MGLNHSIDNDSSKNEFFEDAEYVTFPSSENFGGTSNEYFDEVHGY